MRDVVIPFLLLLLPGVADAQTAAPRRFDVRMGGGLARVHVTQDKTGPRHEVAEWQEALPEGAGLASLRVCRGDVCLRGVSSPVVGPLGLRGEAIQTRDRLVMRAGPLDPHTPVTVHLRLTAPTHFTAGRDGILLPARAGDEVRLTVRGLDGPQVGGRPARGWVRVTSDMVERGGVRLDGQARGAGLHVEALAARCGQRRCLRYRMWSPPRRGVPRDVFVLEDVSPSTAAVDPARRAQITARLIEGLPAGSRVRRVAFAWRAQSLDRALTDRDALPAVAEVSGLGPATRISSAWALIEDEVRSARAPLLVVVGDGTLGWWASERDALRTLEQSGAELSVLDLVGRTATSTLAGSVQRTAGVSLDVSGETLPSALPYLAHPVVAAAPRLGQERMPALRFGEERVIERIAGTLPAALRTEHGLTRPRGIAAPWENGLAVGLGERLGVQVARRILRTRPPYPRPRIIACSCEVVGSVSREAIARLRDRWMPRVNACFRDARRRGSRAALSARVEVTVQDGEVLMTSVRGVAPPLAACLGDVPAHTEDIPNPEGGGTGSRLRMNFRFVSDAPVQPPTLPLRRDVAALVDAL